MAVNRTQALVLGFLAAVLIILTMIRLTAPGTYFRALGLAPGDALAEAGFLTALVVFIGVLAVGVVRRWRWLFWLFMAALLAGVLRVPFAAAQLAGRLRTDVPAWYVVIQGLLGLTQFTIGVALLTAYRKHGVWGRPAGQARTK
ncbi:MAG TPA: hypothetical protein VGL93_23345 [Streptosporangiaceae bacterium]